MSDKKSSDSRRKLLKSIAAGSGAIVAGKSLPESWSRPVVDSVMLPAHAQTSPTCSTGFAGTYAGNVSGTVTRCNDATDPVTAGLQIIINADCTVAVTYNTARPFTGTGTIVGDSFSVPISRTEDCGAAAGTNDGTGTVAGTVSGTQITGTASFGGTCDCQVSPARPDFSSTATYTINLV